MGAKRALKVPRVKNRDGPKMEVSSMALLLGGVILEQVISLFILFDISARPWRGRDGWQQFVVVEDGGVCSLFLLPSCLKLLIGLMISFKLGLLGKMKMETESSSLLLLFAK
jgi:hypothetical protein